MYQKLTEVEKKVKRWKEEFRDSVVFGRYQSELDPNSMVQLTINKEPLDGVREKIDIRRSQYQKRKEKIERIIERGLRRKSQIDGGLERAEREYQTYIAERQRYFDQLRKVIGEADDKENLRWLRDEIRRIKEEYPGELKVLRDERLKISKEIVDAQFKKQQQLDALYRPVLRKVKEIAEEYDIDEEEFVGFHSKHRLSSNFQAQFLDFVNRNRSGTYYGAEASFAELEKIIGKFDFSNQEDWYQFSEDLEHSLSHNLAADPASEREQYKTFVSDVTKEGVEPAEVYDFIYGFQYLEATFSLSYAGKSVEELSPGQRGILILIFYLLIDLDKKPLVIDQPEENLDNETVFRQLVQFIRWEKQKRQIVIVTHNPNLAIVCDAENIIYSEMLDQGTKKIEYAGGAIEALKMRDYSLRVLEGTRDAFENRGLKYRVMGGARAGQ